MDRKKDGPTAPDSGAIDLSKIDDEVSVMVRKRAPSKSGQEKPGSRLAAFLRATKPQTSTPPAKKDSPGPGAAKASGVEHQPPAQEPFAPPKAKQWPPSRPAPSPATTEKTSAPEADNPNYEPHQGQARVSQLEQAIKTEPAAKTDEASKTEPDTEAKSAARIEQAANAEQAAETEQAPKKLWPPSREPAPERPSSTKTPNPQLDPPDPAPSTSAKAQEEPKEAKPPAASSKAPEKSPSLADYVPPALRAPAKQVESTAPSWPPPREPEKSAAKAELLDDVPDDIPALARASTNAAKPASTPLPPAPAAKKPSFQTQANALRDKLSKPFAALFSRGRNAPSAPEDSVPNGDTAPLAAQDTAAKPSPAPSGPAPSIPFSPAPPQQAQQPARPKIPSRAPAPFVRTYPVPPMEPSYGPPSTGPAPSAPADDKLAPPPQAQVPRVSLAQPIPAQVPAAFVRTKPSSAPSPAPTLRPQTPVEPQDSGLGTFKRRQTPQQPRRRKQHSYRNTAPDSTVGLRWWYHHWSAVTWLGRSLWIGAFACAWVALSRCLDPAVSDPDLSQVPYLALLGWLLCAGLTFNQRIPSRFRWTGLVLGAANSVALALSWSFRLHQL